MLIYNIFSFKDNPHQNIPPTPQLTHLLNHQFELLCVQQGAADFSLLHSIAVKLHKDTAFSTVNAAVSADLFKSISILWICIFGG